MILFVKDMIGLISEEFRKITYSFYSIFKIILLSRFKYKFRKSNKDSIVVIGNAPSFEADLAQYPEFFKNKDLLCVNNFPATEKYTQLKPTYVFLIDNSYYMPDHQLQPWAKNTLDAIADKTTWEVTLYVPQLAKRVKYLEEIMSRNKLVTLAYYNYTIIDGYDWFIHRLFKRNLGMPMCKNVIVAAIFSTLNMEYKNIYLTGVDSTFFKDIAVSDDNKLYVSMHYFSGKGKETKTGHFYNSLEKGEIMDVKDFLNWCSLTFLGYKKIEKYSKFVNAKIINTTKGSMIDAFERKALEEL